MRGGLLSIAALVSMLWAGGAIADHEIGPIWKHNDQAVVCMIRCNEGDGCDELSLEIVGPEGNLLDSQTWTNLADQASRQLAYNPGKNDSENPLSCQCVETEGSCETSVAILRNRNLNSPVVAYSHPD